MALSYNATPYTLEADRLLVDAAPLAAGDDEAKADEIVAASAAYVTDNIVITITPGAVGLDTTLAFEYGNETPGTGFIAYVDWGDGVDELADNIDGTSGDYTEKHAYAKKGVYAITVTIVPRVPKGPSLQRTGLVTIV